MIKRNKRAFLISPIRDIDVETIDLYRQQYDHLVSEGWDVYWPYLHTNQAASEISICNQNCAAIASADTVFVIWDGKSQGCLFDLGMAFTMSKPIRVVIGYMPNSTSKKSFQNLIYGLEELGYKEYRDD